MSHRLRRRRTTIPRFISPPGGRIKAIARPSQSTGNRRTNPAGILAVADFLAAHGEVLDDAYRRVAIALRSGDRLEAVRPGIPIHVLAVRAIHKTKRYAVIEVVGDHDWYSQPPRC